MSEGARVGLEAEPTVAENLRIPATSNWKMKGPSASGLGCCFEKMV